MKKVSFRDAQREKFRGNAANIEKPQKPQPDHATVTAEAMRTGNEALAQAIGKLADGVAESVARLDKSVVELSQQLAINSKDTSQAIAQLKPEKRFSHWVFEVKERDRRGNITKMDARGAK